MARKVVVQMVDDYDGQSPAEETVNFALDGIAYEIDLSVLNASSLRGIFEQWTPYARKVGRTRRARGSQAKPATDRDQTAAIRDWARKKGIEVSSRGRIAAEVIEQYKHANQ
ncbi:histone-like nucleoid-structuring protein Lsr2 [Nocardia farcinica]|uniref:histone-like nucleoid-structuring protein Lsr2 n=1 Tax=Nocardia farcinica TaxID=37329 RepID=UPI002453D669|nr:Lsr2 family protein [Nocardia farcinica]